MSGQPIKQRHTNTIGSDSFEFAKAYTHKRVTTTNRSGFSVTKDVLVPLVPTTLLESNKSTSSTSHISLNDNDVIMQEPSLNESDGHMNSNKSKVS